MVLTRDNELFSDCVRRFPVADIYMLRCRSFKEGRAQVKRHDWWQRCSDCCRCCLQGLRVTKFRESEGQENLFVGESSLESAELEPLLPSARCWQMFKIH